MGEGYIAQIFRSVSQNEPLQRTSKHIPMLNSINRSFSNYFSTFGQVRKKRQLMAWCKSTPELVALISKVAKDIVYRWHFETVNPKESGRNKIMAAEKFAQEVVIRQVMLSQVFDALCTGEAFGWIGTIKEERVKKELQKIIRKEIFLSEAEKKLVGNRVLQEFKIDGLTNFENIDEDVLKPRKYRYMASTTVEVVYDQYDVLHYNQLVAGEEQKFSADEIIRFTLMSVDGKVNGFTPVESIVVQLELLRQMWQNMLSLHRNGGAPDKLFVLENMKPTDPAYERIEEQLKKYKLVENKHGNMLFTGKVSVQDLQQLDKMQFMDSGLYITGLMAMQWEIPRSSIPYIVGGANTKDDTGGNSEKGYWRNIEYAQKVFEDTMNTQLWIPYFGVKMVFENSFVQQDVQSETALNLKYTNLKSVEELLNKGGLQLSELKRLQVLGLTSEDVEEYELSGSEEKSMEQAEANSLSEANGGEGPGNKNQLSKSDINDSDDKKNKNKKKSEEQAVVASSRGMKPTGVSKEKILGVYEPSKQYLNY